MMYMFSGKPRETGKSKPTIFSPNIIAYSPHIHLLLPTSLPKELSSALRLATLSILLTLTHETASQ